MLQQFKPWGWGMLLPVHKVWTKTYCFFSVNNSRLFAQGNRRAINIILTVGCA